MNEIKEISQIIELILQFYHLNAKNFAEKIGTSPTQIYDLRKGKIKKLSPEMLEKILTAYPELSRSFLLTGEGEMFVNRSCAPSINTFNQQGNNTQTNGVVNVEQLFTTISSQQQTIQSLVEMLKSSNI
jgi:transcriptional regulator with XRE-family HTH domain